MEYDDRISADFVKTKGDLETEAAIKAAFADGSIEPHARGVSSVQRVPLKINTAMLPLLREFAGEKYKRDIVVASALGDTDVVKSGSLRFQRPADPTVRFQLHQRRSGSITIPVCGGQEAWGQH